MVNLCILGDPNALSATSAYSATCARPRAVPAAGPGGGDITGVPAHHRGGPADRNSDVTNLLGPGWRLRVWRRGRQPGGLPPEVTEHRRGLARAVIRGHDQPGGASSSCMRPARRSGRARRTAARCGRIAQPGNSARLSPATWSAASIAASDVRPPGGAAPGPGNAPAAATASRPSAASAAASTSAGSRGPA
jgi:hypothetical protein